MRNGFNWDKSIDNIQFVMLWFVVAVVVICVSVLILFDILAGAGVMTYLTNGNTTASVFISLATSGLLISLMFLSYNFGKKKGMSVGLVLGGIALLVYCLDVYFDSMTADYLRYGQIMVLKEIPNYTVQLLFRCLIGGISTVGESLAMAIIVGMPVLKEIINKAIPESLRTPSSNVPKNNQPYNNNQSSRNIPPSLPRHPQNNTPQPIKKPNDRVDNYPTYHLVSRPRDNQDSHYDN